MQVGHTCSAESYGIEVSDNLYSISVCLSSQLNPAGDLAQKIQSDGPDHKDGPRKKTEIKLFHVSILFLNSRAALFK